MHKPTKRYLGDGVYVKWDGFTIWLTTEGGTKLHTNTIALEPQVVEQLERYIEAIRVYVKEKCDAAAASDAGAGEGSEDHAQPD